MPPKLSQSQFLTQAEEIHGNTYDYSKTNYQGYKSRLTIGCKIHGYFKQTAAHHLMGHGCQSCGPELFAKVRANTSEEFVQQAQAIFGNKYDYSMVSYVNCKTPVIIVCEKHGSFLVRPDYHLRRGMNCCKFENRQQKSQAKFIENAVECHGNLYDYSLVCYAGSKTLVTIRCKIHGQFEITPYHHLQGFGCKDCLPPWGRI